MKCSNMIWSGIFLLLAGCSSDRLITTTDQYGRSLSVLHTEDQIFQGPIVVEIGQFDSLGKFNPYATATGEPLIQSVFRGAAPAALGAALLRPPETNINASGGSGGGAGTGSTGIGSGSAGGASTGGGVVNVNSAATSNSRSRGGSATGGQASSGSSTSSATSSPTVTGTVGSSTSSATGGSSGTGGSACQGNCGGGNNGNGNSP